MGNLIIPIGPRCVGKTSVGLEVASTLGLEFIDADDEFVKRYGNISDFVKKYGKRGWEKFREYEARVIEDICKKHSDIVFTPGGGAVAHDKGEEYRQANVAILRQSGKLFYLIPSSDLEKSAKTLTDRMLADPNSANSRPALTEETDEFKEMLKTVKERDILYSKAAHETIYTRKMPIKQVAQEVVRLSY